MKKCIWNVGFFVGVFVSASAWAGPPEAQKFVLDNGLTLLVQSVPGSPALAVDALVKTGSATEGRYLGCGITHFVEHMMFKGTSKRALGAISKEVKAAGGYINASTSFDFIYYTLELPAGQLAKGVDILSDMLMNSTFDPAEVEKERTVILGEMRLYRDNPNSRLSEAVYRTVFNRHPYQHPIIGYEPLFLSVTRDDLYGYYRSTHIPNNMIVVVVGDVDIAQVKKDVETAFKDFKPQPYLLRNLPREPEQITPRITQEEYPTDLARLSVVFPGVSILHEDMVALDVLAMLLGQGETSRLYKTLQREKQLVSAITAANFTPMDQGIFEIECTLDEKNEEAVVQAIWAEVAHIQKVGVSEAELKKAKRRVLSQHIFGQQSSSGLARDLAFNEAFVGDFLFSEKYLQAVRNVLAADVKAVAQKYLTEARHSRVVVRPKRDTASVTASNDIDVASVVEKYQLSNGVTVLLKEDHRLPTVAVRLALQGGLMQEPALLNGISNLMAQLWTRGTKKLSAEALSQEIEFRGAGLSGFSGYNSFGLNFDGLAEDLDFGLNLLEDLVKNPTFPVQELFLEKENIKSQIKEQEDNVFKVTGNKVRERLFAQHPYRFDVLGSLDSLERITREDIVSFYNKLLSGDNLVVAVFGDFDRAKILPVLEKKFGALKKKAPQLQKGFLLSEIVSPVEESLTKEKEQAVLMVGFRTPGIFSDDRSGLEVLKTVLGGSMSGRLFVKIREELGHTYTLGGSFTPGLDAGWMIYYVSTEPKYLEDVRRILFDLLAQISQEPISDAELRDTQEYLKGAFDLSLETPGELASATALDELYGLGFENYKNYARKIEAVTAADVQAVAQKYLDFKKAVVVTLLPGPEEAAPVSGQPAGVETR